MDRKGRDLYVSRDPRLANNPDDRPFFVDDSERYFNRGDANGYDIMRNDFSLGTNPYDGRLAALQNNVHFAMAHEDTRKVYKPHLREQFKPMPYVPIGTYERDATAFDESWYGFTPKPKQRADVFDSELKFGYYTVPMSLDNEGNGHNRQFGEEIAPSPQMPFRSIYAPIERMSVIPGTGSKIRSDEWKISTDKRVTSQKKMTDYSASKRSYDVRPSNGDVLPKNSRYDFNRTIDPEMSIRADTLMQIDQGYSLPLWNVTDSGTRGVRMNRGNNTMEF